MKEYDGNKKKVQKLVVTLNLMIFRITNKLNNY